jgi:hypothetical protein
MREVIYVLFTVFAAVGVHHMMGHLTSASARNEGGRFMIAALGGLAWLIFCAVMADQATQ